MNKNYTRASHGFGPVYDEKSRILILGSFPSVKSREEGFFNGHPRNRFWKILVAVCDAPEPVTIEEKKQFLLEQVSKFIVTKLLLEGLLPSFLSLSIIPAIMFAIEATIIWNKNIFVFIGKVGLKLQPLFL